MTEKNKEITDRLLSLLSLLNYRYRMQENGKEQFNIFTALHKAEDEVRLHSRFISVLLSPDASHNKKNIFLELFLKNLALENFELENAQVYPSERHKTEFKQIDILIINRISKQAVIIENKIWARDSNHENRGQIEGYFDLIHLSEGIPKRNIHVFYLTIDGRLPSEKSLGKYRNLEEVNGRAIDYEHEIQTWLECCLSYCVSDPFLRESILQYINLIKKMTHDNTDFQQRLDIKRLIGQSGENMAGAKLLMDNFKHVKWHTAWEFWNRLSTELELNGYVIAGRPSSADITNTTHYAPYKKSYQDMNDYGISFSKTGGIMFFVWNGSGEDWIYWGVEKQQLSLEQAGALASLSDKDLLFHSSEEYYWKYFNLKDSENIFFPDFSFEGTFNLINEEYRSTVISEKIIPEIKQLDFLNDLQMNS